MGQIRALFYRHYLVWSRRLLVFLGLYIVGPIIMLYGLGTAFGATRNIDFILPGIMANSVMAAGFINCSFGAMERLYNNRYQSWLAATMTVRDIVFAEALFQAFRGLVTSTGIWIAAWIITGSHEFGGLIAGLIPMALVGWVGAMMGYCVAALARTFADIELSEPFMAAAFVFSGVFVSITHFYWPLQVFAMVLPIYHGIEVIRPFFMGGGDGWVMAGHMTVLMAMTGLSTWAAVALFKRRLLGD